MMIDEGLQFLDQHLAVGIGLRLRPIGDLLPGVLVDAMNAGIIDSKMTTGSISPPRTSRSAVSPTCQYCPLMNEVSGSNRFCPSCKIKDRIAAVRFGVIQRR